MLVAAAATDPYQAALDTYTAGGRVDYAAIHVARAFDPIVQSLGEAKIPADPKAAMAFWINAYNAITIDLVADEWPLASIRDLDGGKVWDTRKFPVAGKSVTLNEIENGILRPLGDPRVHAALNCASRGCPPLAAKAFAGPTLDAQLDVQASAWIHTNGLAIDRAHAEVAISPIFDWYGDDFTKVAGPDVPGVDGEAEAAIRFALLHDPGDAPYLRAGGYTVTWADYDWGVEREVVGARVREYLPSATDVRSSSMILFAMFVACVKGLHVEGNVQDAAGEPWEHTIQVDIFAAEDVGVDGTVAYDSTDTASFEFDVPAGDWVVTGAAGTCHGDTAVSGTDGESVTATIEMICVE